MGIIVGRVTEIAAHRGRARYGCEELLRPVHRRDLHAAVLLAEGQVRVERVHLLLEQEVFEHHVARDAILGRKLRRIEAPQLRDGLLQPRLAPRDRRGRAVGEPVVVAVDAEERRELGMLLEVLLEEPLEERIQLRIGRGLVGESGARRGQEHQRGDGAAHERVLHHSTFPIFFTTWASFFASASQNARNCGWSRYWIGVSTLASELWNVASFTAVRAASRSFAIATSGVPVGTKSPVHCENCASYPSSFSVGTSGSAGWRDSPHVASTRTLPPFT